MKCWSRRRFLGDLGAAAAAGLLPLPAAATVNLEKAGGRRVVVVGGGFGGLIAARTLRRADPSIEVVLVTADDHLYACPGSNLVVAGLREVAQNRIDYARLAADGIHLVVALATAVDVRRRTLQAGGRTIAWDRLILSPGIELRYEDVPGADAGTTPQRMPHAWRGGAQTSLLREQLRAMPDGGSFIIAVPRGPIRGPAAPYERACLVADYFEREKPKSRVVVIDENPKPLMKAGLFQRLWQTRYGGRVDYRPGRQLLAVLPDRLALWIDDGVVEGAVINLIPPQAAGRIAHLAGVVGEDGRWCPVDPTTFESRRVPGIHVIGDACIAAPMPKTGFSANSQAKICALNLAAAFNDRPLVEPSSANVTYSFVSQREAMSSAAVYRVEGGAMVEVPGAGGDSAEPTEVEYLMGMGWLDNILAEMAG